MSDFIKLITCQLSKKIFKIPVLANDNCIYEAEIAINLAQNKEISPITNKIINDNIIYVIQLKSLIDMFLENNKHLKEFQYTSNFNLSNLYSYSKLDILNIFVDRVNYTSLLKYGIFKISDIDRYAFKDFLRKADKEIIIHFLDHCDDLEYNWDGSWNLLNFICRLSTPYIINYLIDKGVNLEHPCNNGYRPIHQVANLHDGETTRKLINKGVNLLSKTNTGETAIDVIFSYQDKATILFTLDFVNDIDENMLNQLLIRLNYNEKITVDDKEYIKQLLISMLV